jgi:endogenous inhibitor of DNA gyrase (YacG/DUF329 family)
MVGTNCCPICKQATSPWPDNASFPFCSARCKLVDLGNWLDERYALPTMDPPSEEEPREEITPTARGGR